MSILLKNNQLGKLVLMRHGETQWAKNGQFTGRTDLPLTSFGKQQARGASVFLKDFNFMSNPDQVYVSPLLRAKQTAKQVGFEKFKVSHHLAEWDYGPMEGHKRTEMNELLGREFNIWTDGVMHDMSKFPTVQTPLDEEGNRIEIAKLPGESLSAVQSRANRFLEHVSMDLILKKDILVIAHSHILVMLAMCWASLDPKLAGKFVLDTTGIITLGIHNSQRAIFEWNKTTEIA